MYAEMNNGLYIHRLKWATCHSQEESNLHWEFIFKIVENNVGSPTFTKDKSGKT